MQPKFPVCTFLDKQAVSISVSLLLVLGFWLVKTPPSWLTDGQVLSVELQLEQLPSNTSAVLATHRWLQNGEALQQLLPQVHGVVPKAGMAERLHWSQTYKYAVAREAIFDEWRHKEQQHATPALQPGQNITCAAARHPPVPHHHCHVFVNHQYRIAYIRSPKSSSTSIMNWLGQCNFNKTRNWNSTTCMHYTWEKHENLTTIKQIWHDYFFFGFIRNPWNRAYSLYKDMTATNHFKHRHGPQCKLDWGDFCRNPFSEFDNLQQRNCTHVEPHYAYWHMMDQYHCMITPTGEWAVDYLGRVEAGDQDWRTVVEEMNRRRLPGVPEVEFSSYGHIHSVKAGQQPPPTTKRRQRTHSNNRLMLRRLLGPSLEFEDGDDSNEGDPDFAAAAAAAVGGGGGGWGDAGSGAGAPDGECSDPSGPYCNNTLHCIDAVSQWYACDIEHFGYLPPLPPAPASAPAPAAAPTTLPSRRSGGSALTAAVAAAEAAAALASLEDKRAVAASVKRADNGVPATAGETEVAATSAAATATASVPASPRAAELQLMKLPAKTRSTKSR